MIGSLILGADNGGFWAPIAKPLAAVLAYFYSLIPNYGVAIVLLTIAMMILLTPLTIKQTRSMLVMQKLQPEMKKLQDLHKNDRQALNEAVMALYKEHNASPLGGCLPMLLPFPLFIALLRVLEGLSHTVKTGKVTVAVPKYLTAHTRMAQDIVKAHGQLDAWGLNLAKSARNAGGGFGHTFPYFVLLLFMVGTQFYQQYQLTSKNPAAKSQPGQAMMMKLIPLFFGFISLQFPAGVVLYWTVSNVIRIGQQWALYRYDPKVKALVTKDVKEIEAKTREIEARESKPTIRTSLRDRLTNAMDAGTDRKGKGGKDAAPPTGKGSGDKAGGAGRAGRTPPGKAPRGTPNAAKSGRPGAAPGAPKAGAPKPGAPRSGAAKAGSAGAAGSTAAAGGRGVAGGAGAAGSAGARGAGKAGGSGGASKPGAPRAGSSKPGAPNAGSPRSGAPRPGAPRPGGTKPATPKAGAPRPGASKPGGTKPGSPAVKPPNAASSNSAAASDSGGVTPGGAKPGSSGSPGPAPDGRVPDSAIAAQTDPGSTSPANGGNGARVTQPPTTVETNGTDNPEGADNLEGTDTVGSINNVEGTGDGAPNGNGAPAKGRTGGGSARNVTGRSRRRGR